MYRRYLDEASQNEDQSSPDCHRPMSEDARAEETYQTRPVSSGRLQSRPSLCNLIELYLYSTKLAKFTCLKG